MHFHSQQTAGQQLEANQISSKTQTVLNIGSQEWKSVALWWAGSVTFQIPSKLQAWDLRGQIFIILDSLSSQMIAS